MADVRPTTEIERSTRPFKVESDFQPSGDQPAAIEELTRRIRAGERDVVLLGATGTGAGSVRPVRATSGEPRGTEAVAMVGLRSY